MYYNMAHIFLTELGLYLLVLDLSAWLPSSAAGAAPAEPGEAGRSSLDFWLAALFVHAPGPPPAEAEEGARLIIAGTHLDVVTPEQREEVFQRVDDHLARQLERMPSLRKQLRVNEAEQLLFFPVDNTRATEAGVRSVERLRAALGLMAQEKAKKHSCPTRFAHFFHVLTGTDETAGSPATSPRTSPEPRQRPRKYVSLEDCQVLARACGLTPSSGELDRFLRLFHSLGHLLYFPGSPAVVLDPQWLLDAMAQVVDCPRVLQGRWHSARELRERGLLSPELLSLLWQDPRFQRHEHILRAFLEHFDLLVRACDDLAGQPRWLVPSLLPPQPGGAPQGGADDALLLDFHGALQKLLPSLLPRVLCQLRRRCSGRLVVRKVFKDFLQLSLGPSMVMLDVVPAAGGREMLRMRVRAPEDQTGADGSAVEAPVGELRQALRALLPHIAFSMKARVEFPQHGELACCKGSTCMIRLYLDDQDPQARDWSSGNANIWSILKVAPQIKEGFDVLERRDRSLEAEVPDSAGGLPGGAGWGGEARPLLAPPSQGLGELQSGAELLARLHGSLLGRHRWGLLRASRRSGSEASLGPAQSVQVLGLRGIAGACAERPGPRAQRHRWGLRRAFRRSGSEASLGPAQRVQALGLQSAHVLWSTFQSVRAPWSTFESAHLLWSIFQSAHLLWGIFQSAHLLWRGGPDSSRGCCGLRGESRPWRNWARPKRLACMVEWPRAGAGAAISALRWASVPDRRLASAEDRDAQVFQANCDVSTPVAECMELMTLEMLRARHSGNGPRPAEADVPWAVLSAHPPGFADQAAALRAVLHRHLPALSPRQLALAAWACAPLPGRAARPPRAVSLCPPDVCDSL
ncbi:unnamed protein product [Prorocentrum cordatum]|uniref:COR domain-containing protein n=1 Tax=Prorocentrum cordatum TaxID=2364126 RepID=A0ABN9XYB0_9DINO|nr:unnamed protein product [Polarella glacialis]